MGFALHLNKLESHFSTDALCHVWLNRPCGSGVEDENAERLQRDEQTDGQTVIRKAHLSLQLR